MVIKEILCILSTYCVFSWYIKINTFLKTYSIIYFHFRLLKLYGSIHSLIRISYQRLCAGFIIIFLNLYVINIILSTLYFYFFFVNTIIMYIDTMINNY